MAAHARPPSARWVGRYYKRHILTAMMGFGARWLDDRTGKTSLFVHERFPHGSVQPLGGWAGPEEVRIKLPAWLPDCLKYACVRRAYGFFLQTEDGSHADNRVLAGEPPTLDYELARMPELAREHAAMVSAFGRALLRAGLVPLSQRIGPSGTAHCVGTLIAGADPMQSVVDARGRVHGLGNLYVVDGSVLPRLGRMNPSLTIYAWALRVAQLLCESRNAAPT
jgi:choline dehydrogenase-like flavoprotein